MANTNRAFSELILAVKTEMQLDPGLISDEERKQFINDCLSDLGKSVELEKSSTLAYTNGVLELPDDYVGVIAVVCDGRVLTPSTIPHSTGVGSPSMYYVLGNKLYLSPRDTGEIDLIYYYQPPRMSVDTDKPDIPNGYDSIIVDYAVAKCYRKNGNIGVYREYMSFYEEKKYQLKVEMTRKANTRIVVPFNNEVKQSVVFSEDILL